MNKALFITIFALIKKKAFIKTAQAVLLSHTLQDLF